MNETVVTFKNKDRAIAMYFTQDETGNLDMQMNVSKELDPNEDPDLAMLLASTFLTALNPKTEDDKLVYNGQD